MEFNWGKKIDHLYSSCLEETVCEEKLEGILEIYFLEVIPPEASISFRIVGEGGQDLISFAAFPKLPVRMYRNNQKFLENKSRFDQLRFQYAQYTIQEIKPTVQYPIATTQNKISIFSSCIEPGMSTKISMYGILRKSA